MGGKLMTGFLPGGIIGSAIKGIGAAAASDLIPVNVPFKHEAAAGLAGGIPGLAAVVLLKNVGNPSSSGTTPSGSFYV